MVMPAVQVRAPAVQSGIVVLTGGINESITNLELREGELLECDNYFELDGPYHGYTSLPGYEVFDGTEAPSEVPLIIDPETGEIDDGDRELRRREILPVPGQDAIRGVHMFKSKVYSVRDAITGGKGLYEETPTGWNELSIPASMLQPSVRSLNPGGNCDWVNGTLSKYPDVTGAEYPPPMTNVPCFFMVDGVSKPISYDGISVRLIDDDNLPSSGVGLGLPVYATNVAVFDNRLWLAFPGGHLFYSELGDAGAWDGAKGAGSIPTGDEITDLIVAPGNVLVVFMRNSTKIVYIAERPTGDYAYQLKEFSQRSGCLFDASDRLLGEVYYIDDRGPTTMSATDEFGDFGANAITKKVQRTFLEKKDTFTASVVQRELNQWRIFFADGTGMCFTFHNKRLKGTGFFKYPNPVVCVTEGEDSDGSIKVYFGSTDGFVYQMDSGTSLDGAPIDTLFTTSYYHYKSPTQWKRFLKLLFEISAQNGTTFYVRTDYDYKSIQSPKNAEQSPEITGFGGTWGLDKWSEFIYGDAYVQNPTIYIQGYGVNMSVIVRTSEKYKAAHIVHNFIANYESLGQKM